MDGSGCYCYYWAKWRKRYVKKNRVMNKDTEEWRKVTYQPNSLLCLESHMVLYIQHNFYIKQHKVFPTWKYYFFKAVFFKFITCICAKSLQLCLTLCDPVVCSPPGSAVYEISRQEYWSGLPCPPLGALPDSGIEPASFISLALAGRFFTISATWEAHNLFPNGS